MTQHYEPIAPVDVSVGGDDTNKFAVKYKKEIKKIYEILNRIEQGTGAIVIDAAMSENSQNPVENRAIYNALKNGYFTKSEVQKMLATINGSGGGGSSGDAHSYRVQITQSAHQQITVRKFLPASSTLYTNTFTAGEPFWNIEVSIEADVGYVAGDLVVNGVPCNDGDVFVLDRDFTIYATEALGEEVAGWTTVYINGTIIYWYGDREPNETHIQFFGQRTTSMNDYRISKEDLRGKVNIVDISTGTQAGNYNGHWLIGSSNSVMADRCRYVTHIRQNIKTANMTRINEAVWGCYELKEIDCSNWRLSNVVYASSVFGSCSNLREVGNISGWDLSSCIQTNGMFSGCPLLESLDLSRWKTGALRNVSSMFSGCTGLKAVDISGWDTSQINDAGSMFSNCTNLQYIIMDAEEIKFSGGTIFPNPHANVTYLVPTNWVSAYNNHANWSSRASQIDDIAKYTISRYDGKVAVTENA